MTDFVSLTENKTIARYEKQEARTIASEGFGASPISLKITESCLPQLITFIKDSLSKPDILIKELKATQSKEAPALRGLIKNLQKLSPETLALCSLNAMLHAFGKGDDMRKTALSLGGALSGELWVAKLLKDDAKLMQRIESVVRKKHSGLKQRQQAARSMAAANGYAVKKWTKEHTLKAGGLMAHLVLKGLPEVFYTYEGARKRVFPAVHEAAADIAAEAVQRVVLSRPVTFPSTTPPLMWTGLNAGGYADERLKGRITFLRKHSKIQASEARDAIRSGQMQPALDAVNALQAVPWTINKRVLGTMYYCIENQLHVKGLPRFTPYDKPPRTKPWEDMSEDERRAWRRRADKIETTNRGLIADRVLFEQDIGTAELLSVDERFYTPFNADWRGRVYPMSHFNFQRDDRVRALFLFADGAPIGVEGLHWLKMHVANCGDFGKISKRPIAERIEWVDANIEQIKLYAEIPLKELGWTNADKPFLFLAACMELASAIAHGPDYVTRLPVAFDGSCSGLQHLAAMTQDAATAKLVNISPSAEPQDVYHHVAAMVIESVKLDLTSEATIEVKREGKKPLRVPVRELAERCLAFGIDRKLVKRNVMTFSYASKKFGMAQQHKEDLMRPLETKVMAGELDEHPFGEDNGRTAAKYLAEKTYNAIEQTVPLPAEAMGFLQDIARALSHEGKPVRWTTPAGLPWVNAYFEPQCVRVRLWLHDASVTMKLATGDTREVDRNKSANGVAPNFVHACDAAHLMLTVNAAVEDGIRNIATVHDSFGCLAPMATRFNEIVREQFALMYIQHDVLAEVLEQSKCDLTEHNWHRLPEQVGRGNLNIEEIKHAPFAFA